MKKQKKHSLENITWSEMGKQNVKAEKVYCSQPTRTYGLPKIHRPSALDSMAPFRPIVSSIGTYNYEFDK